MNIRKMEEKDRNAVLDMMRVFYASPAVQTNGSEEIFKNDFDACVSDCPYVSGYAFERDDGSICGYAMLAHSYSTEYGKPCIWIEDIYLQEDARGKGIADSFFDMLNEKYPDHLHRLESEDDNMRALAAYDKNGFERLPYAELIREAKNRG